ncbi:MAG: ribose-phosphate diphosphokinase [Deltaproteobacteria bacterium]|nr:ribose-phosphate diphosphokinase [Deltaproteobacteria bacterium]
MSSELEVHAFAEARPLAEGVARCLAVVCRGVDVHRFPDGESLVRVCSDGPRRAVLVRSLDQPNVKIVEILFAADALRRAGVEELVLVAPYLGYMRQDRAFHAGEAVSQRVVGMLLGTAFDRLLTVEAHLHRIQKLVEVFPCQARSVSAAPLIGEWCRSRGRCDIVVGPDDESEPWVRVAAEAAGLRWTVCHKARSGDRDVEVEVPRLPGGVQSALLVDDVASSGATLAAATRGLRSRGVDRVEAVVVHALFDEATERRLREAGLGGLYSTDTVPHSTNQLGTAGLLAKGVADLFSAAGGH